MAGHLELLTHSQVSLARGRNLDTIIGSQTINSFLPLKSNLELTSGAPYPLGYSLNLAHVGSVEGKDSIRLPQFSLLNNDSLSLIISWFRHFELLLFNVSGLGEVSRKATVRRRP